MRKVAVFVNPLLCRTPGQRATVAGVATVLKRGGLGVTVTELGAMPEAAGHAYAAIAAGCDTIFSCGGDGTVFALLQALAGSGIALGIIPMGTGNVLAQNLRLPRKPAAAASMLLQSTPVEVPLGRVSTLLPGEYGESSWYFAMCAGVGAHAKLMHAAERWGKRIGGRASYYFAGIDLLLHHQIECFEVEITTTTGQTFIRAASEALVVRVSELNNWRPGSDLRKPLLRLALVNAQTRLELARASFGGLLRDRQPAPDGPMCPVCPENAASRNSIAYYDVTHVKIRPIAGQEYRAAPLLQADGEVLGASNAKITLAGITLTLLWPDSSQP